MSTIAKANVLVSKGNVLDAVYVNNCLDEIVKQLTLNRQHIDQFYSLYIKILDRLFGDDVSRTVDIGSIPPWEKGAVGGWLRALMFVSNGNANMDQVTRMNFSTQQTHPLGRGVSASYLDSLPQPAGLLLQKFVPFSAVFDILAKIQGGYEVNMSLLPTKLQMYITDHPVFFSVESRISPYICHSLLRHVLHSANQVKLPL